MKRLLQLLFIFLIISCFLVNARTFDEVYSDSIEQDTFKISEGLYATPERILFSNNNTGENKSHILSVQKPYELKIDEDIFLFRLSSFAESSLTLDFFKEKEVFLYRDEFVKFNLSKNEFIIHITKKETDYAVVNFLLIKSAEIVPISNNSTLTNNSLINNLTNTIDLNAPGTPVTSNGTTISSDSFFSSDVSLFNSLIAKLILAYLILIILAIVITPLFFFFFFKKSTLMSSKKGTKKDLAFKTDFTIKSKTTDSNVVSFKKLTPSNVASFDEYEELKNKLSKHMKKNLK